jgi:RimJ/RimL family protein N-acetyltransferase
MSVVLEFLDDAGAFLAATGELLASRPVESTVVATVASRMSAEARTGGAPTADFPVWWVVARDADGRVVGAGMRTAPFAPHPPYLLAMPDEAARLLARALHERGEHVSAINGALPAVEVVAGELAGLSGRRALVGERMRLHEVREVAPPAAPECRLVRADPADADLVLTWFNAFSMDAAEQAGQVDPHPGPIETRESTLLRIEDGEVWLWQDRSGTPVHVTAFNPPSFGVARVGPVYTPRDKRGHGYAAAAVAAVSARLLADGHRVCLFTDQANPVSNALYERLGYRPVVDMANMVLDPPG